MIVIEKYHPFVLIRTFYLAKIDACFKVIQ